MPLHLYTSNRMENLVDALSGVLAEPLPSAFTPELIVVQSKGMQRWLAMELARTFGIWANCNYPFPNKIVWDLFCETISDKLDVSSFAPDVMTWKIMGLLPTFLDMAEFAELKLYLSGESGGLKRYQLSGKIADTFDQYTLYRPDMLLEWEKGGGGENWQSILWRTLAEAGDGQHRGKLREEYCRRIATADTGGKGGMSQRISVFGISYLPRYHMDILRATAVNRDVHLFLLSPTREYWADIISERILVRLAPEARAVRIEGNPLLASLGKLGQDFSDMVIEISEEAVIQEDTYRDPGCTSLLTAIQSDILNLKGAREEQEKRPVGKDDRSVQIHTCHSPLREIEVLHDNLLSLLDDVTGLTPRDIVVMTPDIETYAPYIATVFEGCQDPARKIPYSIADRTITCEGEIAGAVLKLMALPGSRLSVPQVFDILEMVPVRRHFDLDETELELIRGWLEETRVRWGMDEQDRVDRGLPAYRENSWRAGIDRLLLGYAMAADGWNLVNNILPFDEMEGAATQTLGKFVEFINKISLLDKKLVRARTLGEWRAELQALVSDFITAEDQAAHELTSITGIVEQIGELGETANFVAAVGLDVIRSWLTARLSQEEKGFGFLTGGVTFCAMLPMRSIPFRVVALVGMNDGAFPRQSRSPGFDLIAQKYRPGDRSLRDEDRYLFLEAILSTRECFYISYLGQSMKDNSEIPPSVLVSEFLDAINKSFRRAEGGSVTTSLVVKHRLQAFSGDYFNGTSPLFSYSEENCGALLEQYTKPWHPVEFMTTPLDPPSDEWREVPLAKLLRFFDHPARYLLENRLGIRYEETAVPLEEREPFAVNALAAYGLKQQLLEARLQGKNIEHFAEVTRSLGLLPPARHGEKLFAGLVKEVDGFTERLLKEFSGQAPLPPLDFELPLGEFRLSGRLDRMRGERMFRYRCAKIKPKDRIRTWLEHLVLCAVTREGYPRETCLLMLDGKPITYGYVENAEEILLTILDLYREGLSVPMRFFPASSLAYATKMEWSLERARTTWDDGYEYTGEGSDSYNRCCFGTVDPFNEDFERISRTLLEPLLQHQREGAK